MTPQEKEGWFTLGIFGLTLALFLGAAPFVGWKLAQAAWGMIGLVGLSGLFYRRRQGKPVLLDERDRQIATRAMLGAWGVFWCCFVLLFVGSWGWLHWHGQETLTINVEMLPMPVFWAMVLVFPLRAGLIVMQNRRQRGPDDLFSQEPRP